MAQMMMDGILIGEVETKNIMTKSSLPVGGYSVNPYVGCTHACKVLLRFLYETLYRTYRGLGYLPRRKVLADNQKSGKNTQVSAW